MTGELLAIAERGLLALGFSAEYARRDAPVLAEAIAPYVHVRGAGHHPSCNHVLDGPNGGRKGPCNCAELRGEKR